MTVSLAEIEASWSLYDVLDANEALDVLDDATSYATGEAFPPGTGQSAGSSATTLVVSYGGGS